MAVRTWDGSGAPDVQAEPVLRCTSRRLAMRASESTPGKVIEELLATRRTREPFRWAPGTASRTSPSNQSRSVATRLVSVSRSAAAISAARPRPTIPGTFRVPARNSYSWAAAVH